MLNRANPIWNVDANGRQYAFDAALGVQDFTIPQNDEQVFGFVCLPSEYWISIKVLCVVCYAVTIHNMDLNKQSGGGGGIRVK